MSCRTLLAALELTTALSLLFVWFLGQKGFNVWQIMGYSNVTKSDMISYEGGKGMGYSFELQKDDSTVLLQYLFILGIAFLVCLGLTSIGCHLCDKVPPSVKEEMDKKGNSVRSVFYVETECIDELDEEENGANGELSEVAIIDETRNKVE